ncbi:MAG: hypothetical protein ACKO96_14395, partial [Flammeovirgaceae bacterium]
TINNDRCSIKKPLGLFDPASSYVDLLLVLLEHRYLQILLENSNFSNYLFLQLLILHHKISEVLLRHDPRYSVST